MSNQPSLEQALNFTPAELAANRQGHLSDGQRRLLRRRSYYPVAAYSLLAVIILAALFGFLGGSNSPILFSQTGCLVSSPFILVIIFFAILGIRKWKQFNTDVTIGRVAGEPQGSGKEIQPHQARYVGITKRRVLHDLLCANVKNCPVSRACRYLACPYTYASARPGPPDELAIFSGIKMK
jgi:hypothetical protein